MLTCEGNPLTSSCSCPSGFRDYAYATGQSYAYSEWDSIYITHFCLS